MRTTAFIVHFVLVISATSLSQPATTPRQGEPRGGFPSSLVYYEAATLPSQTPGFSRVDVLYRIDMSFFVAVRDPSKPLFSEFVRKGEVQIELMDSNGTVSRKIQRFEVPAKGTEAKPGTTWHSGQVSMDLIPGNYVISFTIEDSESERSVSDRTRRVNVRDFAQNSPSISSPLLVKPVDKSDTALLYPVNFGGGIRFGHAAMVAVQTTGISEEIASVELRVEKSERGKDSTVVRSGHEQAIVRNGASLVPVMDGDVPAYKIMDTEAGSTVSILPLDAEKLYPGIYTLTITAGAESLTQQFAVVWPDMPRSLQNPAFAFDALRFITTSDELDSLESGSEEERMDRFDEFWATKDRTPGTAMNEVMTEYYSRVDHALMTFGTLRDPDGTRTDRGRIHILYGFPTKVERNLDPSGFIEVWSYEGARKKFIFLDETKTGNYVLTSTRPL